MPNATWLSSFANVRVLIAFKQLETRKVVVKLGPKINLFLLKTRDEIPLLFDLAVNGIEDRKSVGQGTSVDLGGRRLMHTTIHNPICY